MVYLPNVILAPGTTSLKTLAIRPSTIAVLGIALENASKNPVTSKITLITFNLRVEFTFYTSSTYYALVCKKGLPDNNNQVPLFFKLLEE